MTNYDLIMDLCKTNNGIITSEMVRDKDIPSWYLSDMVRRGLLQKEARGIYVDSPGNYDEYYSFQSRNSRCIYSFQSALYLLGMTDRVPYTKEVTVYKGYNSSHIKDDSVIHHVNKAIYDLGIVERETVFGNPVKTVIVVLLVRQ